jgi:predicted hydrolase (HD superfamily)
MLTNEEKYLVIGLLLDSLVDYEQVVADETNPPWARHDAQERIDKINAILDKMESK